MTAKQKAMKAAKRMATTKRPAQTVKAWARNMRAVIGGEA